MRKILILLLIIFPITVYGASFTLATYPINVNGQKIAVQPYNSNGVTYLPLRAISEAIGVPITWDNINRKVDITTLDTKKLAESCVMVYATDGKVRSQGSGVYTDYGEILTANHVVEGYPTITTSQGSNLTVQESNKTLDATVLDSAESIKPVKIGDSDEVQLNEKVVFISSPKATINTTTWGTVIRLDNMNDDSIAVKVILNTGSSGGACFNLKGELIGIADAGENGIFFITPINDIRKAL